MSPPRPLVEFCVLAVSGAVFPSDQRESTRQRCCVELFAKMGLTVKIKLIRVLSIVQCWIALWLIVLGIVERARIDWMISGLGVPIWTGVWVRIYYVQM